MSIPQLSNEHATTVAAAAASVPSATISSKLSRNTNNSNSNSSSCYYYRYFELLLVLPVGIADLASNNYYGSRSNNVYYMLSVLVWFSLCVGVVLKHHPLIHIFYSFATCSILAVIMMTMMFMVMKVVSFHQQARQPETMTVSRTDESTTAPPSTDSDTINSNSNSNTIAVIKMMIIRTTIGVLACLLQISLIVQNQGYLGTGTSGSTTAQSTSSIISTYTIVTGYLVFDQWYTFFMIHRFVSTGGSRGAGGGGGRWSNDKPKLHTETLDSSCQRHHDAFPSLLNVRQGSAFNNNSAYRQPQFYKSIYSVIEDAVTLIIFLIMLVQQEHDYNNSEDVSLFNKGNVDPDIKYHYYLLIWPMYKLLRLFLTFVPSTMSVLMNHRTQYQSLNLKPITISSGSTSTNPIPVFSNDNKQHDGIYCDRSDSATTNSTHPRMNRTSSSKKAIWRIYNHEYDLTNFVHQHPGGYEAIMLGCNRDDCTALFRSYHPSPVSYRNATKVLQTYRINNNNNDNNIFKDADDSPTLASLPMCSKTTSPRKTSEAFNRNSIDVGTREDKFYDILCERVTNELWDRHHFHIVKDRTANPKRIVYYLIVTIGVLISAYNYGIRGSNIFYGSIPFAVFGWLFGALGHDAGHYTVCRTYPIVNDICVWAMALLCNPIVWQHQHTYGHHSHTNDMSHDPDLHHFTTFLRVHEKFQYYNIYRFQRHPLYVFFSYMFVVFGTCIWIPWGVIQEGSLYGIVEWTDRHRPWRTTGMYMHLIAYTIFIVIAPFFVHAHWYTAWLSVSTHISLSGIIFAIFSQINHVNELSLQNTSQEENRINITCTSPNTNVDKQARKGAETQIIHSSWAVQQIISSNNFCPQSSLWYYLSNGLNVQIEHHLFPGVNHCHLFKIQPIVQDLCREYGIHYKCYNSWYDIMKATLNWLDRLSEFSEKDL